MDKYNIFNVNNIVVLAENEADAMKFAENADGMGLKVDGKTVWRGPVPDGSYMLIGNGVRMSTPKFYAYRKSNELPLDEAILTVAEILSSVRTHRTCHSVDDGLYEELPRPRVDFAEYLEYIEDVIETEEGITAAHIAGAAINIVELYEVMVRKTMQRSE
jgi:hypothetical protein